MEILKDTKKKDKDGGMMGETLWPQEADPLLLLLLFHNELQKPSFPSVLRGGGAAMGAAESRARFARTRLRGGCCEQGWVGVGVGPSRGANCDCEGRELFFFNVCELTCTVHTWSLQWEGRVFVWMVLLCRCSHPAGAGASLSDAAKL